MSMLIVLLVLGVVVAIAAIGIYNSLISKRNRADEALSSVDVMLKKRFDLVPNLVGVVDRYMDHEREVLRELTELRARATGGGLTVEERAEVDRATSAALGRLMVAVEAYPELRASENFLQLQGALNEIEEQLSAARRAHNAAVRELNDGIQMFPSSIVAGAMSLRPRAYFEVEMAARTTPDVGELFDERA